MPGSEDRIDDASPIDAVEEPIVIHGGLNEGTAENSAHADVAPQRRYPAADAVRELDARAPASNPDVSPGPEASRALGLDAVRGLFLVLMTFGFTIQSTFYPHWMYHRQFPPPYQFVDLPGLAWRDLAYAAFIFTMAAALPITLSRRLDHGETELGVFFAAVRRFVMLFVFALLIGHSNTYFTGYTQPARAIAVLGFVLMFALFVRRKKEWSARAFGALRTLAWIGAIAFLALSPLVYDSAFSLARKDDIITGLAIASLLGSVVWYLTRDNFGARTAVLGIVVALYLGAHNEGWIQEWWWKSPAQWLYRPSNLSLLTVVIPGTIAGDLLHRWMRGTAAPGGADRGWSAARLALVSAIAVSFAPVIVVGTYNRWVQLTTQIVLVLSVVGLFLTWRAETESDRLVRDLFRWAALWIVLGIFLEPAEGGIKKVPDTLSYFFTVSGITMMVLVAMAATVDVLRHRGWARPFIDVGHNPMLCYILYTVLINSVLEMIPAMRGVLRGSPGEALLRSLLSTVLVVLVVQAFTRRKVYLRT